MSVAEIGERIERLMIGVLPIVFICGLMYCIAYLFRAYVHVHLVYLELMYLDP